jgi:NitT/TauT family transport system permease protein
MALYLVSVAVSVVLGAAAGLLVGMHARLHHFMRPIVLAMYSTPTIVLIPLLVIWFGDGALPVFVLVFIASFFPMLFNTQLGVEEVGPDMIELGRAFGATRKEQIAKIIAPSMLPYVFSGLKIAVPRGFIAILAAEMLITARGMGGLVLYYGDAFQTDRYFVPVIMLAATAYLISEGLYVAEKRLMPWRIRHHAS